MLKLQQWEYLYGKKRLYLELDIRLTVFIPSQLRHCQIRYLYNADKCKEAELQLLFFFPHIYETFYSSNTLNIIV
jgi:hypothetical protein